MNHELKRVVARDEDCFVILNDEKPTQFECLAHVSIFAKMKVVMKSIGQIQRQYPLVIELKNISNHESVLEIFLSMEQKEPDLHNCDRRIKRKVGANEVLRISYYKKMPCELDTLYFGFLASETTQMVHQNKYTQKKVRNVIFCEKQNDPLISLTASHNTSTDGLSPSELKRINA